MCFSAAASFTAAAITGGIGLVTLSRVTNRSELPLAAVPLLFALQQTIEGGLWLTLDDGMAPGLATPLTYGFLLLAEVWWPIFVPIAVLLAEPEHRRRRLILVPLLLGTIAGLVLLWSILTHAHHAEVINDHMVYASEQPFPFILRAAYFIGTVLPPLLSSRRIVAILGLVVLAGAAIAYIAYWQAFVSVWCFFAAAASGIILFHFERLRRQRESGITT